jgi:hypothetical protein
MKKGFSYSSALVVGDSLLAAVQNRFTEKSNETRCLLLAGWGTKQEQKNKATRHTVLFGQRTKHVKTVRAYRLDLYGSQKSCFGISEKACWREKSLLNIT